MITAWVMVKIGQNVPEHQTAHGTFIGGAVDIENAGVLQSAPVTE
jgi:hypothetical protein